MASINITIPDAVVSRVLDALSAKWGYDSNSGLNKAQFARQTLAAYVKATVREYESHQAAVAAKATAQASVDSEITIT